MQLMQASSDPLPCIEKQPALEPTCLRPLEETTGPRSRNIRCWWQPTMLPRKAMAACRRIQIATCCTDGGQPCGRLSQTRQGGTFGRQACAAWPATMNRCHIIGLSLHTHADNLTAYSPS